MKCKFVKQKILALGMIALASTQASAQAVTSGAAAPGAPQQGPGWLNWVFIGGMFFVMWFFLIRPQSKRAKEHKKFLDELRSGQEVVTQGGVIGRIVTISDNIITLDTGSGNIRILKSSISCELGGNTSTPS